MARDWHIRFFLTPRCNFACTYCNPEGKYEKTPELSTQQCKRFLTAARNSNIKSVHWTGGEPLIRSDILELVAYAKQIGFEHQVMTTNGALLGRKAEQLFKNGLSRVNLSIDTLDRQRFKEITQRDALPDVLDGLNQVLGLSAQTTKLNTVVTQSNLSDAMSVVRYATGLLDNKNRDILVKLICINPNNPTMLSEDGIRYYEDQVISDKQLMDELSAIGQLEPIGADDVVGDNPNCKNYLLDSKLKISILSMPSWDHPCGGERCKKLRITPYGQLTTCLNIPPIDARDLDEQTITLLMNELKERKHQMDKSGTLRKHYSADIGSVRFGKISEPIDYAFFQDINMRQNVLNLK